MKAVVFGAGKIARGFIGQLLDLSSYEITFIDANKELVNALREAGKYSVHILGDSSKDSVIEGFDIFHVSESGEIARAMKQADIMFVSVGGNGLKHVGQMIGELLSTHAGLDHQVSLITCENVKDAAAILAASLYEKLSESEAENVKQLLGITEAVVMRTATIPSEELQVAEPLSIWVQNYWNIPVDKARYKGKEPAIKGLELIDGFGNLLTQKMYTNNTSNAVIAYNGHLFGYEILSEAARSPEVSQLLDAVYPEINAILIKSLGISPESQHLFSENARKKYEDPIIVDRVVRHAKDPIRKLGPNDRLIGPARLGLANGITPHTIVDTIAKALYYDEESDEESKQLKAMRHEKGMDYVLETVCGLEPEEPLFRLIKEQIALLKQQGVLHD